MPAPCLAMSYRDSPSDFDQMMGQLRRVHYQYLDQAAAGLVTQVDPTMDMGWVRFEATGKMFSFNKNNWGSESSSLLQPGVTSTSKGKCLRLVLAK